MDRAKPLFVCDEGGARHEKGGEPQCEPPRASQRPPPPPNPSCTLEKNVTTTSAAVWPSRHVSNQGSSRLGAEGKPAAKTGGRRRGATRGFSFPLGESAATDKCPHGLPVHSGGACDKRRVSRGQKGHGTAGKRGVPQVTTLVFGIKKGGRRREQTRRRREARSPYPGPFEF